MVMCVMCGLSIGTAHQALRKAWCKRSTVGKPDVRWTCPECNRHPFRTDHLNGQERRITRGFKGTLE
jgi:hypothetical protein